MTIKEVIKEVERMKLEADTIIGKDLLVIYCGREPIASIDLKTKLKINTDYWAFTNLLAEDEREKIYVLLTKLAETDPQDRGEEKKYYLRHKWIGGNYTNYLNFDINGKFEIESKATNLKFQTKFTQKEIDKIKIKFNTNLEDFEIVEVKNEIEN